MYNVLFDIQGLKVTPIIISWNRTAPFTLTLILDQGTWVNISVDWNDTSEDFRYVNNITEPGTNVYLNFLKQTLNRENRKYNFI